eukprot:m51a1_g8443 hypothetical protein (579) ;mRNA; r:377749-379762
MMCGTLPLVQVTILLGLFAQRSLSGSFVHIRSAADSLISVRAVITADPCNDVAATTVFGSDAYFMFRVMPALDGSNTVGTVSLMSLPSPSYYLCSDFSGRISARWNVLDSHSRAQCTFRVVPGLSDPTLVSLRQGGRYVGDFGSLDGLRCQNWFPRDRVQGWSLGLVDAGHRPERSTWAVSALPALYAYVQDRPWWLSACEKASGVSGVSSRTAFAIQPGLQPNVSAVSVSLRLYGTELYLGADPEGAGSNDTWAPAPRLMVCHGREAACTWLLGSPPATMGGVFLLINSATGLTLNVTAPARDEGPHTCLGSKILRPIALVMPNDDITAFGLLRSDLPVPEDRGSGGWGWGWASASSSSRTDDGGRETSRSAVRSVDGGEASDEYESNAPWSLVGAAVGGAVGCLSLVVLSAVATAVVVAQLRSRRGPSRRRGDSAVANIPLECSSVAFVDVAAAASSGPQSASPGASPSTVFAEKISTAGRACASTQTDTSPGPDPDSSTLSLSLSCWGALRLGPLAASGSAAESMPPPPPRESMLVRQFARDASVVAHAPASGSAVLCSADSEGARTEPSSAAYC